MLTPKQQLFVQEYLIDLNATQAAIRAGYSEKTANEQGCRLLAHVSVSASIQEAMDKRSNRTQITADNVLNELAKLGFGNIQNLYTPEGALIPIHQLPPEVAATVTEITERVISSDGESVTLERKYKVSDKRAALVDLGKHLKLFTEKTEMELSGGLTVKIVKFGSE